MSKKRVLVIDDEQKVTRLIKQTLEVTKRYDVREANTGKEGLVLAKRLHPHLILLDVMMPEMDGVDVASALQADERLKRTPIIFITGAVTKEETHQLGGVIGQHPCIAKPIDIHEVLSSVEEQFKK